MDYFGEAVEYQHYWEASLFQQTQELESLSSNYDSSSPDGNASLLGSKNILSERNRRRKLNERLIALRAVVPNITKMDKASIIKDAISYIQELNKQRHLIKAEISDFEYYRSNSCNGSPCSVDYDDQFTPLVFTKPNKRKRVDHSSRPSRRPYTMDDLEVKVSYAGNNTVVLSLTCSKKEGRVVKLCELMEVLKLKILTAHITAFSERLLNTIFVEVEESQMDHLRMKIETVMASTPLL